MTEGAVEPPSQTGPKRSGPRATSEVLGLAAMLGVAAGVLFVAMPQVDVVPREGGWWAFAVVTFLFGLFEYRVFLVEFRLDAISFSLSELPTAFAIVMLSPGEALLARLPISFLVLVVIRRSVPYKVIFNSCLWAMELMLAIAVFRLLIGSWGTSDAATVGALVVSLVTVVPFSSIWISVAIGRFEGGTVTRIIEELRATWWMYTVNNVLATMTVALALIEPALALLAVLPGAGMWYVLHAHGLLGQRLRDLEELHGFTGRVSGSLNPSEVANVAVAETVRLMRARSAALVRFEPDGRAEVHRVGEVPLALPDQIDSPGWSELISARDARLVDIRTLPALDDAIIEPGRVLVAPVTAEIGPIAILIALERAEQTYHFDAHDVARAQNLTEQLASSLRKAMLHQQLEFEARHDALTGLPARTAFESVVARTVLAPDPRRQSYVIMLDLDRFKEVNDTLGHHAGDNLLIQFADRMSRLLDPDDVLARLAGDEFAILCHREDELEVMAFAESCVRVGSQPVWIDGLEIVVTVSVGVARITSDDKDALQPIRRADIAMYNAKWQRSGVENYRDEIDRRTPARLSMLGDLRAAIETNDLDVVYQPKLDLATGRVVGVEALVRWEHASRGVVAPKEFVRVAEDTGLIKDLTDFVLARGIASLRRFQDAGLRIGLAVNLSTHDLFDSRLPTRVRGYLESNGVEAGLLTLEITESSLLVDAPRTRATIDDLHHVGLRLSVDDFGTGYSSLSYLRRLPVQELKIDQSFVGGMLTDPQDDVIVRSTIDLGHNLGLIVVAEGVEDLAAMARLRDFGCNVAQGYGISPPLSAEDLISWITRANDVHPAVDPTAWVGSVLPTAQR